MNGWKRSALTILQILGIVLAVILIIRALGWIGGWVSDQLILSEARAEEAEEITYQPLYVKADLLYGREWPTKKSQVMAYLDFGDAVQPTGNISKDCEWVEVIGGENGTMWVCAAYVSERFTEFTVTNENNGPVKIRSKMGGKGKVKGYVRNGKSIEIDRVVLGWGHCSRGWVDLEYLIEEIDGRNGI